MAAVRSAVVDARIVTDALIAMLAAATGKPVGDHDMPDDANPDEGYFIVYGIDGGEYNGPPLWAPEADAVLVRQVTSVGSTRDHAEGLADRVRLTLCSRVASGGFQVAFPVLAGAVVTHREPDGLPPGVIPEGPPNARTFSVPERYRLAVVAT